MRCYTTQPPLRAETGFGRKARELDWVAGYETDLKSGNTRVYSVDACITCMQPPDEQARHHARPAVTGARTGGFLYPRKSLSWRLLCN
jgi:hypothetical protein